MRRTSEEYEPQFAPGAGSPKVRRVIERINRIVSKMLRAGIEKRDIDFLVKAYEGQGESSGKRLELERQMEESIEIEQNRHN